MSMAVEWIASIAESAMVVGLCNRCLELKNKRFRLLKYLGFLLVLSTENIIGTVMIEANYIADILLIGIIGIYVFLFLDGRIYEKILITIFPAITILPINLIILNMFRTLSGEFVTEIIRPGGKVRIPVLLFSKIVFFLVCEFMVYMRRHRWRELNGFRWGIQLSCFVITYLIGWLLFSMSVENDKMPEFLTASVLIAGMNILIYVLLDRMQRDAMLREEHRLSNFSLAAQEERIAETREQYARMQTLRHDMRHYLAAAAELLSEGKTEAARTYIENVLDEQVNRTVVGIDTDNVVVDAVINHCIAVCQQEQIEMKCMIDANSWTVADTDMSVLLSNLLDNAINGCKGVPGPHIELVIGTKKAFTYLVVKNSIASSVLEKNPKLWTDKEDQAMHGFGVLSIRRVAEKYGGSIEFREEKNTFIAEVWLENTDSHESGSNRL